jgi:3-oxoacyl-[acyl-carrier protein] reductase
MTLAAPRCALVVGGSGGIGSAVVRALAQDCEKVYFTYNNGQEHADQLVRELSSSSVHVAGLRLDLADAGAWEQCLTDLTAAEQVDLLVNAAGISIDGLSIDMSYESLMSQFQINVFAAWQAMSILGRDMAFHHQGRIINVASIAATLNSPGRSIYASTKAALISLTKSFAVELGRFDIRVNAVAPGFVDTDMIGEMDDTTRTQLIARVPLGRFALAEEVAQTVRFLCAPEASYLHGSVIVVDGGTSA